MKKRRIIARIKNGEVTYIPKATLKQKIIQFIYELGEAAGNALKS